MIPKTLNKLYCIRSYSNKEDQMISFIKQNLAGGYKQYARNIYRLTDPTQPVLCAHMDQVNCSSFPTITSVDQYKKYLTTYDKLDDNISSFKISEAKEVTAWNAADAQVSLGADDKNGIYIILKMLNDYPNLNFIFTVGEEIGMVGSRALCNCEEVTDFLGKAPFMLVLDRKNGTDIINNTHSTTYSATIHNYIEDLSTAMGMDYTAAKGAASDANTFKEYLECVNLSVGYYGAHTAREYTDLTELEDTCRLVHSILADPTFGGTYQRLHQKAFIEFMKLTKPKPIESTWKPKESPSTKVLLSVNRQTQVCPLCDSANIRHFTGTEGELLITCNDCLEDFKWASDEGEWVVDEVEETLLDDYAKLY